MSRLSVVSFPVRVVVDQLVTVNRGVWAVWIAPAYLEAFACRM